MALHKVHLGQPYALQINRKNTVNMFTITNCMGKIFGNMLKHSSKILSYLFCAICIIMAGSANAQEQERGRNFDRFSDRLFFGGSFGLAVGSRVTQIDVAPMMGLGFSRSGL
jgi:preprotein translocase subunit SecG